MSFRFANMSAQHQSWQRLAEADATVLLARLSDAGIAAVLLAAPLFMGGRDERGAFVYVMAVMVAVVAYCASQALAPSRATAVWRRTALDYVLLGGLLLICVQLLPLDTTWLTRLSPSIVSYLPLWTGDEGHAASLGTWNRLTLVPHDTRIGAAVYLSHALFFLLLVQRLRTRDDIVRLLKLLAVGCLAFALLGLMQFLMGNGQFLWVYEHPYRNTDRAVKGPFANENHFAHLLALGIGPCIWWLQHTLQAADSTRLPCSPRRPSQHGRRRSARASAPAKESFGSPAGMAGGDAASRMAIMLMFALATIALAGLLTFSRGGAIVLVAAAAVAVGLYFWKSYLHWRYAAALAGSGAFVLIGLVVFGGDVLTEQLETIQSADLDQIDAQSIRRDLWVADLAVATEFRLTGTGVGSHVEVYPLHFDRYTRTYFSHAESGYIQVLLECGLAGIALLLAGLAVGGYWAVTALRTTDRQLLGLAIAAIAGIVASLLHSLWDFVWYLPACLSWTLALAAILCRVSQLAGRAQRTKLSTAPAHRQSHATATVSPASWSWSFATVVLLLGAILLYRTLAPAASAQFAWEKYLKYEEQTEQLADATPQQLSDALLTSIALLDKTVARNPHHAKAHLALASCCLQRFAILQADSENRMDLMQIRAAAIASRFASRAELDEWLARAVGNDRVYLDQAKYHSLRAVTESPLCGEAYVFLADLAFLDGAGQAECDQLLKQARLVRPHNAAVCFAVGAHAAMDGDLPVAMQHWKKAFHQHPKYQSLIVDKLVPLLSGELFVKEFEPDAVAAGQAFNLYRAANRMADAQAVGEVLIARLEAAAGTAGREQAARHWARAAAVYRDLQQPEQAVLAYTKALHSTPDDFPLRRQFALELLRQNRYLQAQEQIEWCLARKPSDVDLKKLALQAKAGQRQTNTGAVQQKPAAKPRR